MVTPLASRPAALTQRQVDDFAAGRQVEHAAVLHVARSTLPALGVAASAPTAEGSRQVDLKPRDLAALAQGKVPAGLARRIAAATQETATSAGKARPKTGKGKSASGKHEAAAGAQPSIAPPGVKPR